MGMLHCSMFFVFCVHVVSPTKLTTTLVKFWAGRISERLISLSAKYSGVDHITKTYNGLNLTVKHYSGRELSEQLSAKFERFFDEKVDALRNLTEAATKLEMEYDRRTKFGENEEDVLEYHNGKSLTNLNLTMDPHFRTGINLNSSIVHVPVEGKGSNKGSFVKYH